MAIDREYEMEVATAMAILIANPKVGRDNTIDGVVDFVWNTNYDNKVFDNMPHYKAEDGCPSWSHLYQIVKEADERLRRDHTASEYYGALIDAL